MEKENRAVTDQSHAPPKHASQTPLKSSSQPEPVERRLPPSTPAPRLPLADLLGNGEEKRRALASQVSPEEHVLWVHAQTPGSSQPAVTPARKRKRARSSSPASSQQDQSNFFPQREAAAKTKPSGILQTPQADPAADLWQRYAHGAEGPSIDKSAAFAHLIRDPSPNSPASVGSVGGLRRWASCGVEWPQSATKRRRVSRRIEELPQHEEVVEDGDTKVSKVGALLERMKETLTKPAIVLPDGPSSSSPLPDRTNTVPQASPLQHRLPPVEEQEEQSPTQQRSQQETRPDETSKPSSDYGDDDLDTDMIDAVESTARAQQMAVEPPPLRPVSQMKSNPASQVRPASAYVSQAKPFLSRRVSQERTLAQIPAPQCKKPAQAPDSDDFDDDDDDLLAVDLDQIAAKYDSQHKSFHSQLHAAPAPAVKIEQNRAPPRPPAKSEDVQVISDDEFGDDDIDIEQLAAAEVAATQAYQASGRTVGLVIR